MPIHYSKEEHILFAFLRKVGESIVKGTTKVFLDKSVGSDIEHDLTARLEQDSADKRLAVRVSFSMGQFPGEITSETGVLVSVYTGRGYLTSLELKRGETGCPVSYLDRIEGKSDDPTRYDWIDALIAKLNDELSKQMNMSMFMDDVEILQGWVNRL